MDMIDYYRINRSINFYEHSMMVQESQEIKFLTQ